MASFKRIVFDFETRSCVDIKKCGAYKYAQHSSTDVTMAAILDIDDPMHVIMWIGPKFRHLHETEISDEELDALIRDCSLFVAHNAPFERAIWQYVMVDKYGFTPLEIRKTWDTAVQCTQAGLPRNLEKASAYWNPKGAEKDMEGSRVMKKFIAPSKPVTEERKRRCPENPDSISEGYERVMGVLRVGGELDEDYDKYLNWYDDKEAFARMVEYCRRDVIAEYNLFATLPPLDSSEKDIWELDQQINDRGVCVDIESAKGIIKTVTKNAEELMEEAKVLTNGEVTMIKSPKQIRDWLEKNGINVDSVDKASVEFLLSLNLKPEVRRFLEIRQTLGKSSVSKYDAMLATASNKDNKVRGVHAFYGAGTGRWAGRLLQTQNLPRPTWENNMIDPTDAPHDINEEAIDLIASGEPELVRMWFKDVNVMAADCLRSMIIAPKGKDILCSDFSAVEGRALAYLAGEEAELEAYKAGKDIYKVNAAMIYGIPYEEVDGGGKGLQRQVGKSATLACGYSGGLSAMKRFSFDKIPLSDEDARHAITCIDVMSIDDVELFVHRLKGMPLDYYMEEIMAMYQDPKTHDDTVAFLKDVKGTWIVKQWRAAHPNTVKFWNDMKRASIEAVQHKGTRVQCRAFLFCYVGRFLIMKLPSGRKLYYLDPEVETYPTPWGTTQTVVTSMTENSMTRKMERRRLNISILVENAVQAFCRDLLRESMLRLSRNGYEVSMHIHDEVVSWVDEGKGSVEEYEALMSEVPPWAEGMPLKAAGGYRSKRYKK